AAVVVAVGLVGVGLRIVIAIRVPAGGVGLTGEVIWTGAVVWTGAGVLPAAVVAVGPGVAVVLRIVLRVGVPVSAVVAVGGAVVVSIGGVVAIGVVAVSVAPGRPGGWCAEPVARATRLVPPPPVRHRQSVTLSQPDLNRPTSRNDPHATVVRRSNRPPVISCPQDGDAVRARRDGRARSSPREIHRLCTG